MKDLSFSKEEGVVFALATSLNEEAFGIYLNDLLESEPKQEFLHWCSQHISGTFSVLKNIEISRDHRGQGKGKKLLEDFLRVASGPVILVCDNLERQQEGFKLEDWYESYGFQSTGFRTLSGPIMIKF